MQLSGRRPRCGPQMPRRRAVAEPEGRAPLAGEAVVAAQHILRGTG
ncbi:hypothetical protein [Salipiger marinus]